MVFSLIKKNKTSRTLENLVNCVANDVKKLQKVTGIFELEQSHLVFSKLPCKIYNNIIL